MDENELKNFIAQNICEMRKAIGLTQAELAQKLNYSDKAISKWERAEGVPDVFVLKQMARIFGVSLDRLTSPPPKQKIKIGPYYIKKKLLIPIMSAALCWLAATIVFVFLQMFNVKWQNYMVFIYAVPASAIVLLIFNLMWGKFYFSPVLVSVIIWSVAAFIFLNIYFSPLKSQNTGLIFLIPIPLQILSVLWFIMQHKSKKLR